MSCIRSRIAWQSCVPFLHRYGSGSCGHALYRRCGEAVSPSSEREVLSPVQGTVSRFRRGEHPPARRLPIHYRNRKVLEGELVSAGQHPSPPPISCLTTSVCSSLIRGKSEVRERRQMLYLSRKPVCMLVQSPFCSPILQGWNQHKVERVPGSLLANLILVRLHPEMPMLQMDSHVRCRDNPLSDRYPILHLR